VRTEFSEGHIAIRRYQPDDVPRLFEAVRESVAQLSLWLPWCHANYALDDSAAFVNSRDAEWEKGEHYSFMTFDLHTGEFLGGVGLNFVNRIHNFANLGYWVRSSRTGRGVASAATRLIARFGLEELKFQRLEILAAVDNIASQRVAGKAGAVREAILRKRLLLHGRPHDAVMYSLTVEDLKPR
jgi:RimJ/RimL family protein N-acetyltransferase